MGNRGHLHGRLTEAASCHPCEALGVCSSDSCTCPECGEPGLIRIHRRPVDRILCLFVSLQRFRCQQFECQWEGNLTKRGLRKRTRSRML